MEYLIFCRKDDKDVHNATNAFIAMGKMEITNTCTYTQVQFEEKAICVEKEHYLEQPSSA